MKNKHLSFDDRLEIVKGLNENKSFKTIGAIISKDCPFRQKGTLCNFNNCKHYEKVVCPKLSKPPYVCNGCLVKEQG